MSSNNIVLPNDVVRLILLHCQTSKDYLSQSLVSCRWLFEARRLKSLMKTRFSRKITLLNYRSIIWDFDIRVTVVGHGEHLERHGLEECVQTFHRVGGPGCSVYYLERYWQEGKLHGLEIIREINEIWYTKYYPDEIEIFDEIIDHPYEGLQAVDSMKKYRRHRIVPKNKILPEGCDYLGKIVFKYEWISCILEESQQMKRNLIKKYNQSDVNDLYNVIDTIDLYQISLKGLFV